MPTAIARIGTERDLASLARSLFVIEGENTAELQRQAERALLRDNPQLARPDGFADGAVVFVPTLPGLRLAARVTSGPTGIEALLDQALARLQVVASTIDSGVQSSEAWREATLSRTTDQAFLAGTQAALPESEQFIQALARSIREEAPDADARALALRGAAEAAIGEIERLRATVTTP